MPAHLLCVSKDGRARQLLMSESPRCLPKTNLERKAQWIDARYQFRAHHSNRGEPHAGYNLQSSTAATNRAKDEEEGYIEYAFGDYLDA
jgi:hypothetical protein